MIARKSALIVTINLVNGLLGFFALFLIARFMKTPDFALGVVSFAYSFVGLFAIFSQLGFERAHIKRVSEGKNLETCIGTFATIKITLIFLMTFILFSTIYIWKNVLNRGFETPTHETAVYIMLIYFVLWSLTQIFITTYRAKKEIAKAQIPMLFETVGRVAATVFVIIRGYGVIALACTYVVGEITVLLTAIIFFKGYSFKRPSIKYFKSYIKFALPLIIVVASTKIMINIDKVLIQLFWSATEGGNYFAIFRLSKFLDTATVAIGMLLFPTISELYAKNDIKGIKKLSYISECYLSMIVFPIVFFMIFLAKPIIHILLSNKFYAAVPILQILPLFALLKALEQPYQMKLLGMNLPHFVRNRVLLMVTTNIILNILLIPRDLHTLGDIKLFGMGPVGAAIATVISYALGLAYTRIVVWRISGITMNKRILLHAIAATIMSTLLYYLTNILPINRWYELLFMGILGLGIYIGIMILFREFTKKEFELFTDTLNIKKMIKYIKDELRNE